MIARQIQWLNSKSRNWPFLLLALGALIRFGWLVARGDIGSAEGEALHVAVAFARTGEIADVFGRGSGLTTHFTPVLPVIAGTIYRIFGIESLASELILATLSISLSLMSAALLYRAFGLMGSNRTPRLIALGLFCLLPVNLHLEAVAFRIWEGALATALGAGVLVMLLQASQGRWASRGHVAGLAALAAVLAFISPPLGLAAYLGAALVAVRHVPFGRWFEIGAVASLALAAVLAPWTIRNYQAFGEFIPLRSNFGLELAIANHPAAAASTNDRKVFVARLKEIHPLETDTAFANMQAAGDERAYAKRLGDEAKQWIKGHPFDFARLSVKHLFQYYFPPAWLWSVYSDASRGTFLKAALSWGMTALGLLGALFALFFWRGNYVYAALFALVPSLPYAIVQPVLRYRYLVFAILLFLAVELISRATKAVKDKRDRQVA